MASASLSSLRETLQYTCPVCQYTENRVVPYGTRPSVPCPDDHYNPNRGPQGPHTTFMRIRRMSNPAISDGLLRLSGDHGFTFMDEMAHVNWRDIDSIIPTAPTFRTAPIGYAESSSRYWNDSLGDLYIEQCRTIARLLTWPEDALLREPQMWRMTQDPITQRIWITDPAFGSGVIDGFELWRELYPRDPGFQGAESLRRFLDQATAKSQRRG